MHRKCQRRSRNKHEGRLHQVPEMQSMPGMVREFIQDRRTHRSCNGRSQVFKQQRAFEGEEYHGETAEKVEGEKAGGWLGRGGQFGNLKI